MGAMEKLTENGSLLMGTGFGLWTVFVLWKIFTM